MSPTRPESGGPSARTYPAIMEPAPKKSAAREASEALVVAAVSAVPLAGGPLSVAVQAAMGHMYGRRMTSWLDDLADVVTELQARESVSLEDLISDEAFADAVVATSRAAQATHSDDKLRALKNGLRHSVGEDAPELDEQARFFRLVDEMTPAHLRVLNYLRDPEAAFVGITRPNIISGSRLSVLVYALPEFAERDEWLALLVADLTAAQLVKGSLGGMVSEAGLYASMTTPLGERFLDFISA